MPLPCPDCSAPLADPPGPACATCGLPLLGPDAARLYALDTRLAALAAERAEVLAVLRAARTRVPVAAGAAGSLGGAWATPAWVDAPVPAPVPQRAPRSPQTVLLGLGALLLLVATSVFLAFVWILIGVVGQAAVMVGLTAGAGAASVHTARRGLGSTGTALAWLAAGLTAVAVQAGRSLGLPGLDGLSGVSAVGVCALVGTAAAAATARRTGQSAFAVQAVLSSGLVLPALLVDAGPAVLVAVTGGWGLAALAVAGLRPGLLSGATAGVVRQTGTAAGGLALLLAVVCGLLSAVEDPGSEALRTSAVVVVLTLVVLAAAVRRAPGLLAGAAPAAGAAVLVLLRQAADSAGGSADDVAAAVGAAAWLLAGLLLVRPVGSRLLAVAPATLAGLALLHALGRQDAAALAVLCAGLAVAALGVGAHERDEPGTAGVAWPLGAAAALSAVAAGLVHAGAAPLALAVTVAALGGAVALVAAWRQEEPEEPGLGAVAGLGLAGALAVVPQVPSPALTAAALLAAGAVLALGYACLPRRGWVSPLGVVLASAASWTLLGSRDVGLLEAYTLPVAALLLVVGLVRVRREPHAPSWATVGPAAAMALVPSAQLAAAEPASVRTVLVTAVAVAVVLLGVQTRLRALVVTGGLVAAELALVQVGQVALYVPRWLVLAVLGGLLLGAGATYEARVQQARAAGRWVRALR